MTRYSKSVTKIDIMVSTHSFSLCFWFVTEIRMRALITQVSVVVGDSRRGPWLGIYIYTTLTNKETSGADQRALRNIPAANFRRWLMWCRLDTWQARSLVWILCAVYWEFSEEWRWIVWTDWTIAGWPRLACLLQCRFDKSERAVKNTVWYFVPLELSSQT